jgi:penicillin-binding protein 1A
VAGRRRKGKLRAPALSPTKSAPRAEEVVAPAAPVQTAPVQAAASETPPAETPASETPPIETPRPRRKQFSFPRFLLLLTFGLTVFGAIMGRWMYISLAADVPDAWNTMADYKPERASRVFSRDGELIGEFFLQKRIVVPYESMPKHLRYAFVAAEDNRFFEHHGIDPMGIMRAAIANARAHRVVQGGSTITQQVAKLRLDYNERSLFRKIREAILAHKLEQKLPKDAILGIYLNHVYLGHGAYGVATASETYFGKDVKDISIAESAMLAGLPKAPTQDSPFSAFNRARDRQHYVLGQMLENKFITQQEYDDAMAEPVAIISKDQPLNHLAAPYFVEHIRKIVQQKYGGRGLFDRGLRIYTTLDLKQQRAAEAAVRHGLDDVDRRFGFRGPIGHLEGDKLDTFTQGMPQPVTTLKDKVTTQTGALLAGRPYLALYERAGKKAFARLGAVRVVMDENDVAKIDHWLQKRGNTLTPGDLIPVRVSKVDVKKGSGKRAVVETNEVAELAQQPEVQSALLAMDPQNGFITAMVGGYDYNQSQFNRATQAKRQAGSSIKPYIYSAALEHGYTEVSIVQDAPVTIKTAAGFWSPHNYKGDYLGAITLRTALQHSINTVSVRLVADMGVDKVIDQIRRFGITAAIVRHPSIALGTPEVTMLEHVAGYAVFASGGYETKPVFIEKILDADGNVIEAYKAPPKKRVLAADTAYVMVDLMKNVVQHGTGQKAKELGRPTAGKTGTSNDFKDNWFMAFTRDLVCGVWVGRDDFKTIGNDATGGTTAGPIWTEFMKAGHPNTPIRDFDAPSSVYFIRATPDKGMPAKPGTPNSVLIPFKRGTVPSQFAKTNMKNEDFGDQIF